MVEPKQPQNLPQLYAGRLRDLDPDRLQVDGFSEAFDTTADKPVIVAAEPKARNPSLEGLANVEHAHLARVVAVVDHEDQWLIITDAPRGTKLSTRVSEIGRKHAVDAVRTALRVADALGHLHDAGVIHGRVNPENILLGLEQTVEPALLYAAPSAPEYCRPEKRTESGTRAQPLDARDDTWAATAILYFMLTGGPPPGGGVDSVSELEGLSIDDALLCQVLVHGLARDEGQRAKNLTALRRELARWFVAHAADEPIALGNVSHKPPPLPPSVSPRPRRSLLPRRSSGAPADAQTSKAPAANATAPDPRSGWLRSLPIAVAAAVIGIGAAWGLSRAMKPNKPSVAIRVKATTLAPVAEPSGSAGPIDLAEVPVTGKEQEQAAGDPTANCAKGYLREGTLTKFAQLDGICKETELPRALGTLRVAFTTGATQNAARFDTLGWYSLPLLGALRQACCTEAATLKLPDFGDACPEFGKTLEALAHIAATTQQFDRAIEAFAEATKCAVRTGRASGISSAPSSPAAERAFRDAFAASATP